MTFVQDLLRRRQTSMEYPFAVASATSLANRRRLLVFGGVFAATCVVSLAFTLLRAPEYRASTMLNITPGSDAPRPIETVTNQPVEPVAENTKPFLTEVQVLSSRPVLEETITRLEHSGLDLSDYGPDRVAGLQSVLQLSPVSGTNVVELSATGKDAAILAPLLNTQVEAYRDHLAEASREAVAQVLAATEEETQKLEGRVAEKRHEAEMFRIEHNIVSLERDENQILAQVRGSAASLNTADERVAVAEGRLRSINESAAAGKSVTRSRDDPTLANLEQRASMIREELGEIERRFTPDYMTRDPDTKAKLVRLEELERQIEVQRKLNSQAALAEAREELASARETASRIRQQADSDREAVQQFSARFNEYTALQNELTELETLYRAAAQRGVRLEASERARLPSVEVLELATTPRHAWRPPYARDSALSLAGSFVVALLAMWFVELFNRPEPQSPLVFNQPATLIGTATRTLALEAVANPSPAQPLLSAPVTWPPELAVDEVAALLRAANAQGRLAMQLILCGVSPEEALALGWDDVDMAQRQIRVRGASARQIPMTGPLFDSLGVHEVHAGSPLLADPPGRSLTMDDLHAATVCAAHDAGLEQAGLITPAALRHTCISYLVRQGILFADLIRLVGRLPAEAISAYSSLSPPGQRATLDTIERVLPPLRG